MIPSALRGTSPAAVNTLLDDSSRREQMGKRARVRVEEDFGWTSIARHTLAFYGELVERRRGGVTARQA